MSALYEIGPFLLDAEAGIVTRGGVPVPLGARGAAVLATLVKSPNEFVQKSRILDAAWPGVVVSESNLAVQISALRRVLAQADGDRWIETLARRGYRFVGPVKKLRGEPTPTTGQLRPQPPQSNLPEPLTSFIGRERELVEIKRLLPTTRLLTLVGVGGTGKTRLALQLGAEVLDAYHDGVWFVDLAAQAAPDLVSHSVARVLGVREEASRPLAETLCDYVKARQLLLILDNCEHLLDTTAALADALLRACADATIIATSREPLEVAGEQIYALPTLSLPDASASMESVSRSEAVQLFVARAQRQRYGFSLTEANAAIVAKVCTRLDGIPLALELAAARVRSLSIEEIHARLDDRFGLLTGGVRTALPRQQTLRGALDWSYDLLTERKRIVLRRIAIFSGTFTLDAASFVAADKRIDGPGVIDRIAQLVTRSLVTADTRDSGSRYRLLETTRAYALEKLAESGETAAIRGRHAQYLCDLFGRAPVAWLHLPDANWHATYVPELDNLRAALDWAFSTDGETVIGIGLAGASAALWPILSIQREGRKWLEVAANRIVAQTPEADQARVWLWLGLLRAMEEPALAAAAFERAADLYRRLRDPCGLGYSLLRLGGRLARVGELKKAECVMAEAHPLLERTGSPKLLGDYFSAFGYMKYLAGDPDHATEAYESAVEHYRHAGSEERVLNVLGNLADLAWARSDLDAALAGFRETVALMRNDEHNDRRLFGTQLLGLAGVHTERGDFDAAFAAAQEGLPLLESAGCAWAMLDHMALRAALIGRSENAARIAGYQDAVLSAKKTMRLANETRARDRVQALLQGQLAPEELDRLLGEGARFTEAEACRVALEA